MYFTATLLSALLYFLAPVQLILYLIGSVGLYSMANNTGMAKPWMAWIPIARDYLLGSMADRYNRTCLQKKTRFDIWLTVLCGVQTPMFYVSLLLFGILTAVSFYYISAWFIIICLSILVIGLIDLAYTIVYLICFYHVMMDYEPSRALLYTILSFFNLGNIALFLTRRNVPVGVAGRCDPAQPKYNVN